MSYFNIVASTNENTVVTEYEPVKVRSDTYQSEAALEKEFIRLLCEQGYLVFADVVWDQIETDEDGNTNYYNLPDPTFDVVGVGSSQPYFVGNNEPFFAGKLGANQ